jgi:ABC-type antimicrobial peptide transport system permease subunit
MAGAIVGRRFSMLLVGAFAVVALVLAAIGLYGVLSSAVAERTREIGIRMALGAGRSDVFRLVTRQSLLMVAAGLLVGLAGALAAGPLLAGALFQVSSRDPVTFTAVPLLLAAVAAVAVWVPARRATRVDPMVALREE